MKKIFVLSLISCFLSQAQAQSVLPGWAGQNPQAVKHLRLVRGLLKQQNSKTGAEKPTAIKQRVIAQVFSDDSGADSVIFRYSGTRGSAYDFNNIDVGYRDYFADFYDPADLLYGPAPSSMLADSISGYQDGNQYDLSYAYYREDNQIDSSFEYDVNGGAPGYKYLKVYDAQGYLSEVYELHYGVSGYDTMQKQKIYYNNDHSLVLSDTFWAHPPTGFELSSSNQYYYTATGKLDSFIMLNVFGGPLEPSEKTVMTYYPDNRLQTVSVYLISGIAPENRISRDTFAYAPGINYYTQWVEDYWYDGSYEGGFQIRQFPGANGLPDSLQALARDFDTDPWENQASLIYQYNSYNNPMSAAIDYADGSPGGEAAFYYEEYDDGDSTGSIKPVTTNNDFKIYPNPFSGQICFEYKGKEPVQHIRLKLVNSLGQTVFEAGMQLRAGNNYISVPDITPGNYFLVFTTEGGQSWSKPLLKQ